MHCMVFYMQHHLGENFLLTGLKYAYICYYFAILFVNEKSTKKANCDIVVCLETRKSNASVPHCRPQSHTSEKSWPPHVDGSTSNPAIFKKQSFAVDSLTQEKEATAWSLHQFGSNWLRRLAGITWHRILGDGADKPALFDKKIFDAKGETLTFAGFMTARILLQDSPTLNLWDLFWLETEIEKNSTSFPLKRI